MHEAVDDTTNQISSSSFEWCSLFVCSFHLPSFTKVFAWVLPGEKTTTPCSFNNFSRGVSYRGLAAPEPPPVGLSPGGSNRKLQTNEDHLSAQLDEIWMMVLSTASLMYVLSICFQNQKTLWNRSNRKLQTWELVVSTRNVTPWIMVQLKTWFKAFQYPWYRPSDHQKFKNKKKMKNLKHVKI